MSRQTGDSSVPAFYSALMSGTAPQVVCDDCGVLTDESHDYTQLSYLHARRYRCPNCYTQWRRNDHRQRGQLFSCASPRCTQHRMPIDAMFEVMDAVTGIVAVVCPQHYDMAQLARVNHGRMVDEQRTKDIMAAAADAVEKAAAPKMLVLPGNPAGAKHIAATLALIAPDLDETEIASVAESFFQMAQPVLSIPAYKKPGDADPKAGELVRRFQHRLRDTDAVFMDYLSLMDHDGPSLRVQYQRAFGDKTRGIKASDMRPQGRSLRGGSAIHVWLDEIDNMP